MEMNLKEILKLNRHQFYCYVQRLGSRLDFIFLMKVLEIDTNKYRNYLADLKVNCPHLFNMHMEKIMTTSRWRRLRFKLLSIYNECQNCGNMDDLVVDHILPRAEFPELALDEENLQILCSGCNTSKGKKIMSFDELEAARERKYF